MPATASSRQSASAPASRAEPLMDADRELADVLVVGSANLDLVARTARHPLPGETVLGHGYEEHPGGKGLNQAVAAARSGARTRFVAAVGHDNAGDRLREVAAHDGINVDDVTSTDAAPTGRAMIIVDDHAENSIVVIPGANEHCPAPQSIDATVVLVQLEVPLDVVAATFAAARSAGALTVLNPAPATELSPALLGLCDVVIPNEHEVDLLGGVDALHAAGVSTVIVTQGAAGIRICDANGTRSLPAFPVTPVDTTGAGDAFCGAFAAGLAAGLAIDAACARAVVAGALATTQHGAVPSLPTSSDIDAALSADA